MKEQDAVVNMSLVEQVEGVEFVFMQASLTMQWILCNVGDKNQENCLEESMNRNEQSLVYGLYTHADDGRNLAFKTATARDSRLKALPPVNKDYVRC